MEENEFKGLGKERILSLLGEQNKKIESAEMELAVLKRVKDRIMDALSDCYTEQYSDLIGKKVKIEYKRYSFEGIKTLCGYLKGFSAKSEKFCDNGIRPLVAKMKSDGSESKNMVPAYCVPIVENIVSMELSD